MATYLGHYEIRKELGSGHFGTVYLGFGEVPRKVPGQPRPQLVAIKKLRDPTDGVARRTLKREFDLLEQVRHRSVCKVFHVMAAESAVVMEYVHGVTLREVLEGCAQAREAVFTEAALEIWCELVDCLYQAYYTPGPKGDPLRLVHRDLKPENVMLTPEGEVKIVDFGLARIEPDRRRGRSTRQGTPLYMAPEQALDREIDHRTDLFATGLIVYELLAGQPAYDIPAQGPDPVGEVMRRIEGADLAEALRDFERRVPGPASVLIRCLKADSRLRYQDGHELMRDLRGMLYKDRGAYLREFCDYFFSAIHTLRPAEGPATAPSPATGSSEPRRTDPMSKPKRPSGPPRPNAAGGPPRPSGARQPPRPRPGGAGPGKAQGGKGVWTPPAKTASAPERRVEEAPPPPRDPDFHEDLPSSARRPDETGMLPMQSLGSDEADDAPNSSTTFFAIPKAKRSGGAGPRATKKPTGGGGRAPAVAQMGSPPGAPPGMRPPGMAAAPAQPQVGMAPGPPMASMGMGIQGPVASAAPATPFTVDGAQPDASQSAAEGRGQTWKVFAVLLALMFAGGTAAIVMVVAIVFLNQPSEIDTTPRVVETTSSSAKDFSPDEDTGVEVEPAKVASTSGRTSSGSSSRSSGSSRSSSSGASTASAPAPPPPPPPATPGPITFHLTNAPGVNYVEVRCDNVTPQYRGRGNVEGGTATVPDVPVGDCKALFRGAVNAEQSNVKAGQTLNCSFPSATVPGCS